VYAFILKGSVTVSDETGDLTGFHALDDLDPGATATGHFWVVAPPYSVLDASLSRQRGYISNVDLPETIVGSAYQASYRVTEADVVAPRMRGRMRPDLADFQRLTDLVGAVRVDCGRFQVRYIPSGVVESDTPLEEWCDYLNLGTSPQEAVLRFGSTGRVLG